MGIQLTPGGTRQRATSFRDGRRRSRGPNIIYDVLRHTEPSHAPSTTIWKALLHTTYWGWWSQLNTHVLYYSSAGHGGPCSCAFYSEGVFPWIVQRQAVISLFFRLSHSFPGGMGMALY